MQNVEIKAELRDIALARTLCHALHATLVETMRQTDVYFKLADGRLKRRTIESDQGNRTEYIFYHRSNEAKSRISRFKIYSEPEAKLIYGQVDPPIWVTVKKKREVFIHEAVRIHLDTVEGLGNFIEFEALVTPRNNLAKSYEQVDALRRHFAPVIGEPLSHSYSDLLAQETEPRP